MYRSFWLEDALDWAMACVQALIIKPLGPCKSHSSHHSFRWIETMIGPRLSMCLMRMRMCEPSSTNVGSPNEARRGAIQFCFCLSQLIGSSRSCLGKWKPMERMHLALAGRHFALVLRVNLAINKHQATSNTIKNMQSISNQATSNKQSGICNMELVICYK